MILRRITVKLAERIVPNGANKPLKILGDDNKWYIAKLKGAERMGPAAFLRELAVSKLASSLDLLTPEPVEILIIPELVATCVGKDFWQLINHLFGNLPDPANPSLEILRTHLAFPFLLSKVVDFNLFCAKLEALPADFWDLVYAMVPLDWKNSDTDQQILKIKKHFEILVLKYYELAENLKNSIL